MASSNIVVTHAETGLVTAEVVEARRISPNFVRVTIEGDELAAWRDLGFDQWFRLAVPTNDHNRFDNLSDTFNTAAYLKYLTLPKATRPVIRNYTVREFRREQRRMDIDFVVHGDHGIAGPWAQRFPVGDTVGLIDQGCGFTPKGADTTVLVGDETALPAVVGILRDLPREASGHAIIELADLADRQDVAAPDGFSVHWLERAKGQTPAEAALARLRDLPAFEGSVEAFAGGESKLATGARRHLVGDRGVAKQAVSFCGYWRHQ
ncbi:siderophore-interacting protein [Agromyces sp. LHK192]|uniref:siderophore-interacting protein n=1 Tax=Agromyces sp. LHK192 TaxID=2498704 RepID=UPI000FDCCEEE|nr:siderophore-interacting protein [Agromyces sp. LHK192]